MQTPTQKLYKVTHFCITLWTLRLKKIPDDDSGIFTNSIKYYIISRNSFKVIYFFHSFCIGVQACTFRRRGASLNNLGSGVSLNLSSSGCKLEQFGIRCKLEPFVIGCKLEQFGIRCKLEPFVVGCKLVSVFLSSLIIYSSRCKLEQFGIRCKLEPFVIGCKLVPFVGVQACISTFVIANNLLIEVQAWTIWDLV